MAFNHNQWIFFHHNLSSFDPPGCHQPPALPEDVNDLVWRTVVAVAGPVLLLAALMAVDHSAADTALTLTLNLAVTTNTHLICNEDFLSG